MKRFVLLPVLLIAMLVFAACAPVAPQAEEMSEPTAAPTDAPAEAEVMDIVDTAVAAGSFNTCLLYTSRCV